MRNLGFEGISQAIISHSGFL
ncbi:MAG: hypothetical protein EZS28_043602, partial [Streblomastix strix]